ncbi:MAG: DUF2017 family protein [Actinobacteria bacterium]|nr:DUF2017 family protein [Actinomycetota bacterium]
MLRRRRPLLEARAGGRWVLHLDADERAFLARLAGELAALLQHDPDDPGLRRLFPPAHTDDIASEAEYQIHLGADLRASREASLGILAATAERTTLDEGEVTAWVQALNAVRLVLGTRLGIADDSDEPPPDADEATTTVWAVYDFLGWLLDRAVRSL